MTLRIKIILGSTRAERQGENVFAWLKKIMRRHDEYFIEFIDLRDWDMPYFPFPESPAMKQPESDISKSWSAKIAQADAFIIVTPEYNSGYPAVLKNALDYTYYDWNNKPVAFISYSARLTGGARSVEQLRLVAIELQMAPIRQAVHIPSVYEQFDENGDMRTDRFEKTVDAMLRQLAWWADALKAARERK